MLLAFFGILCFFHTTSICSRPMPFKVEREGSILLSLSEPARLEQMQREKLWLDFQTFARSHEDPIHLKDTKTTCSKLQLDNDLYHYKKVDKSTKSSTKLKRVLFLTTVQALFFMTDRWQFHLYLALSKQVQDYHVICWGMGLPGFHINETLAENIHRWFVDPTFDVIITTWNYHRSYLGLEAWKDWKYSSMYTASSKGRGHRSKSLESPSGGPAHARRSTEFHSYNSSTRTLTPLLPGKPIVVIFVHEIETKEINDLFEIRPHLVIVQSETQLGAAQQVDLCGRSKPDPSAEIPPLFESNTRGRRGSKHNSRIAAGSSNWSCMAHPVLQSYLSEHAHHAMAAYMPHGVHGPLFFTRDSHGVSMDRPENTVKVGADSCEASGKQRDILLVGALNGKIYPLRASAMTAKRSYTKVLSSYPHPGYKEEREWLSTLEGMCEAFYSDAYPQQRSYVKHMKSSRFCLIGSRSFNVGYESLCPRLSWALRKYTEAAAAGCIVIGDVPVDLELARYMAQHLTSMTAAELSYALEDIVETYRSDPSFYASQYCRPARSTILHRYTYNSLVPRFLFPALDAYVSGHRGIFQATRSRVLLRNDNDCLFAMGGNRSQLMESGNAVNGLRLREYRTSEHTGKSNTTAAK